MSKKRVLIAVHQLNIGGVQKSLISALNAIDYSKNDVTLYIRRNRTELLPFVNENVSEIIINEDPTKYYRRPYVVLLQGIQKITGSDKTQNKLREYIAASKMKYEKEHYFPEEKVYDVAISYIQSYTAKFVAEKIKAKRKVMFFHGSTDENHIVNKTAMADYDMIYCVSRCALDAIAACYPEYADKMGCLENYIDDKAVIVKAWEYTPNLPKDKLILCSCGRITKVKGFDLAVKAADALRSANIEFKWYFVGDGAERTNVEKMIAERDLRDNIVITGLLDNPYPYIKGCDIYVQPSYEEAHPLSLIEAKILCRPIVTTATAGGKSVVEDGKTGSISEIDPESLAHKIKELSEKESLRKEYSDNLSKIDHEEEFVRFCEKWATLLGDEL